MVEKTMDEFDYFVVCFTFCPQTSYMIPYPTSTRANFFVHLEIPSISKSH